MPVIGRLARALDLFRRSGVSEASESTNAGEPKSLKAIVVYYSATGSTGKIAGAIYRGMKSVMDCDIAPIDKIAPEEMAKYDVIAIGGPIWYLRETANLGLFIYKMPRMTGKLCITFCSHGASPDGFFYSLAQPLRKKEFTFIGWNDWYGDATHVLHMPQPYTTYGYPDQIDLQQAEAFGKEMSERAQRIYAGERNLIPEIPEGPDVDSLWVRTGIEMDVKEFPRIDTSKCVYPRCTSCMDNCIANAIKLSVTTSAVPVSGSSIFFEGCKHCGKPLCERSCSYDAISYPEQIKTKHVFNMTKCTYPKCTLCIDNCTMDSIDFSRLPPVVHNNCEGCDLCWCICSEGAIDIPNIIEAHASGPMAAAMAARTLSFRDKLDRAIASGRFRPLLSLVNDIGWDNQVYKNTNAPRVVLHEENYPYQVNKG